SYSETARHIYYPLQSLQEYNNYDPENLLMRSHNSYILDSNKYKKGVNGYSILFELSSMNFPLSFLVDIMHALFENIAPYIKYYQKKSECLQAALISFHYFLHIAELIYETGPAWATWQFSIERLCGMLIPL
ncbi:14241_t:CDS:2, partial [Cetraspora pellucida]